MVRQGRYRELGEQTAYRAQMQRLGRREGGSGYDITPTEQATGTLFSENQGFQTKLAVGRGGGGGEGGGCLSACLLESVRPLARRQGMQWLIGMSIAHQTDDPFSNPSGRWHCSL